MSEHSPMPRSRAAWLARLSVILSELQPEFEPVILSEDDRLGEDLGLDSLRFEALFARLRREVGVPIDPLQWFDALEAGDERVAVLLDLIEDARATAHA